MQRGGVEMEHFTHGPILILIVDSRKHPNLRTSISVGIHVTRADAAG